MGVHATLSPSSASQWSSCFAAPAMQLGLPESSSVHSEEGTGMHEASEVVLANGGDIFALVGQVFNGFELTVDSAKMLNNGYITPVRQLAEGGVLLVEERLSITHITGEDDACGTSDTVILKGDEIIVGDLKWGMGVQVFADGNEQLVMYGLAAYEQYAILGDFKKVRLLIFQPRLKHVSEWVISVEELLSIGERLSSAAKKATSIIELAKSEGTLAISKDDFQPSQDNCRWCKAKPTCPSLRNFVLSTVFDDFDDITNLDSCLDNGKSRDVKQEVRKKDNTLIAKLMGAVGLISDWCKAVVAYGESEIHAGREVPGYKLVQGKQGNRKWIDEKDVEKLLKSMKLKQDQMYKFSLISPTEAGKLLDDNPKRWAKLKTHITQSPGSPTVVPESDKRPALLVTKVEDMFEDESFDDLI